MISKKALIFSVLVTCTLQTFASDNSVVMHEHALNAVPTNAVAEINYFSNASAFTSPDNLVLTFNNTTLCLYTDSACTLNPICANPVSPNTVVTTNFDLASTNSYYITFGVANLNNLANQGAGPTHYQCAKISVGYSTTRNTPLALDNPTVYTCPLASTGSGGSATFIGGSQGQGNPCGVPQTQFIFPS